MTNLEKFLELILEHPDLFDAAEYLIEEALNEVSNRT